MAQQMSSLDYDNFRYTLRTWGRARRSASRTTRRET
jgi:hypothetical protein